MLAKSKEKYKSANLVTVEDLTEFIQLGEHTNLQSLQVFEDQPIITFPACLDKLLELCDLPTRRDMDNSNGSNADIRNGVNIFPNTLCAFFSSAYKDFFALMTAREHIQDTLFEAHALGEKVLQMYAELDAPELEDLASDVVVPHDLRVIPARLTAVHHQLEASLSNAVQAGQTHQRLSSDTVKFNRVHWLLKLMLMACSGDQNTQVERIDVGRAIVAVFKSAATPLKDIYNEVSPAVATFGMLSATHEVSCTAAGVQNEIFLWCAAVLKKVIEYTTVVLHSG